jgi:L-ascorbate metabolism protein UlaG (beta-lactamase superfamily)
LELTYYGNALFTVRHNGFKLLIDPYFSKNPKIYSPKAEYFDDVDAVLITHGHFDHILDMPALAERNPELKIYCTQRVKKNLDRMNMKGGVYRLIGVDDSFEIGPLKVRSIRSTHIKYDFQYIAKHAIDPYFYLGFFKAVKTAREFSKTPIDGECLEFLIEADGESMLISGSLGSDDTIKHPENVDVFVLPYNGRWSINRPMFEHVKRIKPKRIIMSHFDAAFPPLCLDSKPQRFVDFMKIHDPKMEVIIPEYEKTYAVKPEKEYISAASL